MCSLVFSNYSFASVDLGYYDTYALREYFLGKMLHKVQKKYLCVYIMELHMSNLWGNVTFCTEASPGNTGDAPVNRTTEPLQRYGRLSQGPLPTLTWQVVVRCQPFSFPPASTHQSSGSKKTMWSY